MICLLYLLVSLLFVRGYAETKSSISLRLPDVLQHLCPGAHVCRENQTLQPLEKVPKPGFEPCCADCSCSPDCAETDTCCFPLQQPKSFASWCQNKTLQTTWTCLHLTTMLLQSEERIFFQAYKMISSVSECDSSSDSKMSSNISCGDQRVAPWGSMYPVFSKRKNRLYKNPICAAKDGALDGRPFDAFLVCKETETATSDASNFVQFLDSNSNSVHRNCRVDFTYQGNLIDLRPHKCYSELTNECPVSKSFNPIHGTGFSMEEVISACTSGLISPFRAWKMYANVFCFICNAVNSFKVTFCKNTIDRRNGLKDFIGLIDSNFFAYDREDVSAIPKACELNDNGCCRPIFCPSGQLYDQTGKCTYPTKRWSNQVYLVNINLTTEKIVSITELLQDGTNVLKEISLLKSPWPKHWDIQSVFYSTMYLSSNYTHLYVKLINRKSPVRPEVLIQTVKQMIGREWILEAVNKTFILKSDFMAFLPFKYKDDSFFENQTSTILYSRYHKMYRSPYSVSNVHVITKLYLCNQIELYLSEFIIQRKSNDILVYRNISKKYFFDLQYTLIRTDTIKGARICIEDSGLYQVNQFASPLCEINLVLLTIAAVLVLDF